MTSAQVVETSVNVISNSPSQDYTHPDDRTLLYDMTPWFKPFTISFLSSVLTNKSYLLNKYSNFKIIVRLNSMHNAVESVDRWCQEDSTFVKALR